MIYVGFQRKITEQDKEKYNLEVEQLKNNTQKDNYGNQSIDYSEIKLVGTGEEFPVSIAKTKEELKNNQFIEFSRIEKVEVAEMYNGKIYLQKNELQKEKEKQVREIRNIYLSQYIDGVVSNPLRWNSMKEQEKQKYMDYRQYLLDYTKNENWLGNYPKTWDEYFNLGDNNV